VQLNLVPMNIKNSDSIIAKKSYAYSLEIIKCYKQLAYEQKEFILSKQILRSGTSIGANVHEAVCAQSKRDFVHKLSIALKETRETIYWLNLLKDSDYINDVQFEKLNNDCIELYKIISSIIITVKEKYFK